MRRIPQLDGVRGIAVLSVFFYHALHISALWMGVDLFFVLSGFLITGILLDAKEHPLGRYFSRFYSRRARRILVPYLLTLLIVSCFVGLSWTRYWYFYILLTNFLSPLHIPHPSAFEPLWSLAVEEQFYLLWPFAVYFLTPRRLRWLAIALVVVAPILRATLHFSDFRFVYMLTPFRMDLLAAGAVLCMEWRSNRDRIERLGGSVGILCAVIGLLAMGLLARAGIGTYYNGRPALVFVYESTLLIATGVMLYALSGWKVGWLRNPILMYIGQISYTIYLIHQGILDGLARWLHGAALAAVGLALSVGYAALSWWLIESRLLGRKGLTPKPALSSTPWLP